MFYPVLNSIVEPQGFCSMVIRSNGKYMARALSLEIREHWNGYQEEVERPGKILFPKKENIKDLCVGKADIWIEEDHGNYAIAKMQMVKYAPFSEEDLVDFILEALKNGKMTGEVGMEIRRGSLKGDYIFFSNCVFAGMICGKLGSTKDVKDDLDKAASVKQCTVQEFLSDHFGTDIEKLANKFHNFQFAHKYDPKICTHCSNLLDDAVDFGILEERKNDSCNCEYFVLNKNHLAEAVAYFSQEELANIMESASAYNTKAETYIRQQVKRGRLSLSMI